MPASENAIKALTRAVYLIALLLLLNLITTLYFHFNPQKSPEPVASATSSWKPKSIEKDVPDGVLGAQINYGHQLITKTVKLIGPLASTMEMRFSGNGLNCNNCHLDAGRKIGSGSFVGLMNRFPQFSGRSNKMSTIEDRINGCMVRSMNGKKMPENSKEMKAIISYLQWLSDDVPPDIEQLYNGYGKINLPAVKADTAIGKVLYMANCVRCHMVGGTGMKGDHDADSEYLYPPIAGDESYNDGAGMNRVITAAQFIKGNMPFGATYDSPKLTDEEAYHVAAYINSLPRPTLKGKEADYPKIELKPVSTPYGPWADSFSEEQHKYGPFQPIIDFYKEEFNIEKNK